MDIDKMGGYGKELVINDGVKLIKTTLVKDNLPLYNTGTLTITEYEGTGKFIEWQPIEFTIEKGDQDWELVQSKVKTRPRTTSGSVSSLHRPSLQIKLTDLKTIILSKNDSEITFESCDGGHCQFQFQSGKGKTFLNNLMIYIQIVQHPRKKKIFAVMNRPDVANLSKSFTELQINNDDNAYFWNFIKDCQSHPYESALVVFSKVSELFLNAPETRPENENETLQLLQSFQGDELRSNHLPAHNVRLTLLAPPPRILPLGIEQWANFFDEEGRISEENIVKEIIVRGGINPSIRKQVWMYLLEFYSWNSTFVEREDIRKAKEDCYFRMKLQWQSMSKDQEDNFSDYKERKNLIEKDVARTDRTHTLYADDNGPGLTKLQDILMTYVMYNFNLGYVQGMSDLLSPILFVISNEAEAFWCFTSVIKRMESNFDIDQAGMKRQFLQLYQLLLTTDPDLANFLQEQDSHNMFFCFRWLLVWFKREFSFEDILILWEAIWSKQGCLNYHLLICIAILNLEKKTLMTSGYGFTEILKHINELSNNIDVGMILSKTEGIYEQLSSSDEVPNAVREILGFPLKPEPENPPDLSLGNGNSGDNTSSSCVDVADESAFENSINMSFH